MGKWSSTVPSVGSNHAGIYAVPSPKELKAFSAGAGFDSYFVHYLAWLMSTFFHL